jgi:hypothetical protein
LFGFQQLFSAESVFSLGTSEFVCELGEIFERGAAHKKLIISMAGDLNARISLLLIHTLDARAEKRKLGA